MKPLLLDIKEIQHNFLHTFGLSNILQEGGLNPLTAFQKAYEWVAKPAIQKSTEADKKYSRYKKDKEPHYRNAYNAVKRLGYKKRFLTFLLNLTNQPLPNVGSGGDIHKWIGKVRCPKAGWTPGKYKYMGPYNPLDKQLSYNPETGEVTEWKVKPYNRVDEIAAYHDICYDMGRNKSDCDREKVESLDNIPQGKMPKWGQTARFVINTKEKLGLGLQAKNVKRC